MILYYMLVFFFRASPRKEAGISRKSESSSDSFQDFQASVNDAWNCDDEEFSVISGIWGE